MWSQSHTVRASVLAKQPKMSDTASAAKREAGCTVVRLSGNGMEYGVPRIRTCSQLSGTIPVRHSRGGVTGSEGARAGTNTPNTLDQALSLTRILPWGTSQLLVRTYIPILVLVTVPPRSGGPMHEPELSTPLPQLLPTLTTARSWLATSARSDHPPWSSPAGLRHSTGRITTCK
jgi:hypothetical protein